MPESQGKPGEELSTPVSDRNIQTPAAQATGTANPSIPDDHAQQTPEFLQKLIKELNALRQESSELFAKMYPPMSERQAGPPIRPPYEEVEEYRLQDAELDLKISALKNQIQDLRTLLARPSEHPHPGLIETSIPSQPVTDPEVQSEMAKGSSLPIQKQMGGGEPIPVNPGIGSDKRVKKGSQLGKGY